MSLAHLGRWCVLFALAASGGCHALEAWMPTYGGHGSVGTSQGISQQDVPRDASAANTAATPNSITNVSYNESSAATNSVSAPPSIDEPAPAPQPPPAATELSAQDLVAEVQARNPNLQSLEAAWRSAVLRYPQAISLEDPMFMGMIAPGSIGSDEVSTGYTLQGSQKFPWFGKRAARGRRAQAGANAAYFELENGRIRLEEMTLAAYYDYYLARRQLELNAQNLAVLQQFRSTAQSRYESNQVTQQDVLQADVELAGLERRHIELERLEHVTRARINTLLRENPNASLPPPPQRLTPPAETLDEISLQQLAASQRPDVAALRARVREELAAVTLACKDYYPDVDVFGRYDAMWQEEPLRGAVGVNVNMPVYQNRLNAAVREAQANVAQRRAELEQLVLDVQYEVASAYEQLEASRKMLELYDSRLLPAAEQNVKAARDNYDVAKATFFELANAQRQLISLNEEREQALAEYHARLAELNRAVGGSIAMAAHSGIDSGESIPSPSAAPINNGR